MWNSRGARLSLMTISNQVAAAQLRTVAGDLRVQANELTALADALVPPVVNTPSTPAPTPLPSSPSGPVGASGSWKQAFGDEFNGPILDPAKWRRGDYQKADPETLDGLDTA
jgi:hypothetical protein